MSIINYVFRVNNHIGLILVYYRKHACKSCQRYLSKKFPLSCDDLIYGIRVIAFFLIISAICRKVFIYCDHVKLLLFLLKILVGRILINQKQDAPSTTKNESTHSRRSRNDIKSQVLDILKKNGNMSSNEVAIALGYSKLTDTLREVISEMISSGDVTYLYPDKPRSRNQKICLKQ